MDRQEVDGVLSIPAAAELLRVSEQTLIGWVAHGAFSQGDGDHTGIALSALLDVLYRQPGHLRSFERYQPIQMEEARKDTQ